MAASGDVQLPRAQRRDHARSGIEGDELRIDPLVAEIALLVGDPKADVGRRQGAADGDFFHGCLRGGGREADKRGQGQRAEEFHHVPLPFLLSGTIAGIREPVTMAGAGGRQPGTEAQPG